MSMNDMPSVADLSFEKTIQLKSWKTPNLNLLTKRSAQWAGDTDKLYFTLIIIAFASWLLSW